MSNELTTESVDNGRRIIDQNASETINPNDAILIDSVANGSRAITYENLCKAVATTLGISDIKTTADKAMPITTYDKNQNGTVDDAEKLEGHDASYFAPAQDLKNVSSIAKGAMQKETYDADNDGIVDNAALANGHTVNADVPVNAAFTDTIYDDTSIKKSIKDHTDALALKANGQNITFSVTADGLLNIKQEV